MSVLYVRRAAFVATFAALVVAAFASPAAAAIDLGSLIKPTPAPGYVTAPPELGMQNGAVTADGDPAPPGYAADPARRFVHGQARSFLHESSGNVLIVLLAEYESADVARAELLRNPEQAGLQNVTSGEFAGVEGGRFHTWDETEGGITITSKLYEFSHGPVYGFVVGAAPKPGPLDGELHAIATAQYATVVDAIPFVDPQPAASNEGIDEESTPYKVGYLIGMIAVPVGFLAIVAFVIWRVARRPRNSATMAPVGPPAWAAPLPPPPAYVPPAPDAFAAPAPPTPVASAFAPSPAPAPSPMARPTTPTLEPQACPKCSNEFGPTETCASCQAPRTMCIVCGSKIWAGALTCAEHSGMVS